MPPDQNRHGSDFQSDCQLSNIPLSLKAGNCLRPSMGHVEHTVICRDFQLGFLHSLDEFPTLFRRLQGMGHLHDGSICRQDLGSFAKILTTHETAKRSLDDSLPHETTASCANRYARSCCHERAQLPRAVWLRDIFGFTTVSHLSH